MSGLITISTSMVGGEAVQAVNARELHGFLEVGKDFNTWIKDRIDQFGFVNQQDYQIYIAPQNRGAIYGQKIEYLITLNMAKELAMVERNEKGKQARLYFIECEKQLMKAAASFQVPKTLHEALAFAARIEEERATLEAKVKEDQPKVEFALQVSETVELVNLNTFAKLIGTGHHRLVAWMRDRKLLMANNLPYQQYINQGLLTVKEHIVYINNIPIPKPSTWVTGKGQQAIWKAWAVDHNTHPNLFSGEK